MTCPALSGIPPQRNTDDPGDRSWVVNPSSRGPAGTAPSARGRSDRGAQGASVRGGLALFAPGPRFGITAGWAGPASWASPARIGPLRAAGHVEPVPIPRATLDASRFFAPVIQWAAPERRSAVGVQRMRRRVRSNHGAWSRRCLWAQWSTGSLRAFPTQRE